MDGSLPERTRCCPDATSRMSSWPSRSACISITAIPFPLKRHIHKGLYGTFIDRSEGGFA